MSKPLYEKLVELAGQNTARFHIPGHKGQPLGGPLDGAFGLDYTELPETGNLYEADGPIAQAEDLAARYYALGGCVFLTCGATQGVKALLAAFCGPGGGVLLDRNCHKSAWEACALLGLQPQYVQPQLLPWGITGDLSPEAVECALVGNPGIGSLLVTSPTYYGHCMNLAPLAEVCHRHGVALLVDSAHGSHLRACGLADAGAQGADGVVYSAHKTLCALGQGAYLLCRDAARTPQLRRMAGLFGTSSPSYPIMASLDLARERLEEGADYRETAMACNALRQRVQGKTPLLLPDLGDPCRLTICTWPAGWDGFRAAECLRQRGIEPEMADGGRVVCIATPADLPRNLAALEEALLALGQGGGPLAMPGVALPHLPRQAMPVAQALLGPSRTVPLAQAQGLVAARGITPYPPGVPLVAPGEVIEKFCIEYLQESGYNSGSTIEVV